MSLYDSAQQSNAPFMSQFVGSVVPEVQQYSQLVQGRYNQAADSDDSLGEALGNLQHLNFDADTQYANELKGQYYQKLQDRAASGDFENMGRRTRQDAIRFSQAYQPLIQRQKDYAEIVKKVDSDDKISDPNKKAEILQYIQRMNSLPRTATGDFERDETGKVRLNGIQDWNYAKDVDINKKLVDLLSNKEADITAGRYFKDGNGNLINTIKKVRDPHYMAQLANEMMQTDPEIKAMINRDTTLRTYNLSAPEVKQQLAGYGLDKSPYQLLKSKRGANDHEVQAYLKSQGMDVNKAKVAQLDALKAQYTSQGYSDEAAERAILNSQVSQDIRNGHAGLAGGILGYEQDSNDHMTDHMGVIRATAAAAIKDPNVMVFQGNTSTTSQEDPLETAKNFAVVKADVQSTASNGTTAILAALKATGQGSGDPRKDTSTAIELLHNPVKLNALKLELAKTHPQEAQILETVAQTYKDKAALASVQQQHVEDIEKAGGVDWDKLYKNYVDTKKSRTIGNIFDSKIASKEEFQDQVRAANGSWGNEQRDDEGAINKLMARPVYSAAASYMKAMQDGQKKMLDGISQGAGYHPISSTGPGKVDRITNAITNLALAGGVMGTDLNGKEGPVDIVKAVGIDRTKLGDKETEAKIKNLTIQANVEGVDGKPTLTVTSPDGTSKVFRAENLPANIQDEINYEVHRAGASASTSAYGQKLMKQGLAGMGSTEMTDITPQYLKTVNPGASGVVKKLNDNFSTRVVDAGGGVRKYVLLTNNADGSHSQTGFTLHSVDDLTVVMGKYRERNITSQTEQKQLNTQY